MKYLNLHELLTHSSSTRRYYLLQKVEMQIALHKRGDYIHSSHELRMHIDAVNAYNRISALSGMPKRDIEP